METGAIRIGRMEANMMRRLLLLTNDVLSVRVRLIREICPRLQSNREHLWA
jgi:hypothetical protein